MEKLKKYLNRYKNNNISIHPVKFVCNYFYNVDKKEVSAIQCTFGFGTNYTESERKILSYCKKYNYAVAFCGFNSHCSWFYIFLPSAYDEYNNYYKYEKTSRDECEKYMHECYMVDTLPNNNKVRSIMDKYGLLYLNNIELSA